ncbi:hypothetical protein [Niallia taxi]|nr:hypothetical protein [Niallia taxi]MED3961644.1 hypothetical protein [Niallia taxi]
MDLAPLLNTDGKRFPVEVASISLWEAVFTLSFCYYLQVAV